MPLPARAASELPESILSRIEDLGVELALWPPDEADHAVLSDKAPAARLYLVEPGALPPARCGPLEDWARLPASPEELFHRARTLLAKNNAWAAVVQLDDLLLRVGRRSIILSSKEASLLRVLLDQLGQVVSSDDIVAAVWPGKHIANPSDAISNPLRMLRKRLRDTPLRIHTIRGRGLLVELEGEGSVARAVGPRPRLRTDKS